ncbi:MAG: ImmA/IrrE family metallo-endopeptidase [Candidatus Omnitrophica bacterium]|nr:ImmA/IrrE family metallo-endopeptidase [Candidatus Omnitrophota bacterium]
MEIVPIPISFDEIKTKAELFLKTHHPSYTLPIPIEEIIDNQLKIDIIPIPGLKQALQGFELEIDGFIAADFSSISVDDYVQRTIITRYRFTLAHEIAHRELHQYFFEQFDIQTIDDWKIIVNDISDWPVKVIEYEANDFAGLVLVPATPLKEEFEKAIQKADEVMKAHRITSSDLKKRLIIGFLADTFLVSPPCMRVCLERDGWI